MKTIQTTQAAQRGELHKVSLALGERYNRSDVRLHRKATLRQLEDQAHRAFRTPGRAKRYNRRRRMDHVSAYMF